MRLPALFAVLTLSTLGCTSVPADVSTAGPTPASPGEPVVFVEAPAKRVEVAEDRGREEVVVQATPQPSPEATAQAKVLYTTAVERFQQQDFAGALSYFEQAYALAPLPALEYNIAHCYDELGDRVAACARYEHLLLDSSTDSGTRAAAESRIAALGC